MSTSTSSCIDLESRPRLKELISGLLRRVDRYWLIHGLMLTHRREFEHEHRALLDTLRARDPNRAALLLERHLTGASELLTAELLKGTAPADGDLPQAEDQQPTTNA